MRDLSFDAHLRRGYGAGQDWEPGLHDIGAAIMACDHLVVGFPLWCFNPVRVFCFGPTRRGQAQKRMDRWQAQIAKAASTAPAVKRGTKGAGRLAAATLQRLSSNAARSAGLAEIADLVDRSGILANPVRSGLN